MSLAIKVKVILGFSNYDICAPDVSKNTTCDPEIFGNLAAFALQDAVTAVDASGWQSHVFLWAGSDTESGTNYSSSNSDPSSSTEDVLLGFDCVNNTPTKAMGELA